MRSCKACGFFIARRYSANMSIAAIIVAAGRGQRAGGAQAKQLWQLGQRQVFLWSVDAFLAHPLVTHCVLVVPSGQTDTYATLCPKDAIIVEGGETRTASVRAGLSACERFGAERVMIHDAARPGITPEVIAALANALDTSDGAAPALAVVDALKRKHGDRITAVDRAELYRVQTPQAFQTTKIAAALRHADALVDDLAALEQYGGQVTLVPGDERLSKITYADDLPRLERLLMTPQPAPRFGTGFDVHAFAPGTAVTLCGISIPHTQTLAGHSDADVAWHALTDAILGAAALGDIGDHFPPSDPQWKGVDSAVFLKHAVAIARDHGWDLSSCDLTIICEAPKVKPHREAMRRRTAEMTGLPLDAISVKATTTEGLGFTGRGEGIAAQASAVLSPRAIQD